MTQLRIAPAMALVWVGCTPGIEGIDDTPPPPDGSEETGTPTAVDTATPAPELRFPDVDSFVQSGPYATVVETSLGVNCTIHRPEVLGEAGIPHPIVLWGNGTGTWPGLYAGLLSHLASHGFVVAAADTLNAGSGAEMLECLDALAIDAQEPGNVYEGWLDPTRVGAMGHSQGGAGALMAGADPRVHTTVPLQPFIEPIPFGGDFDKASIGTQQGPMLLLSGEIDDIANPDEHQQPVFDDTNADVVWAMQLGANHFAPLGDANDFRLPITAWFRARLMDDPAADEVLEGPCTLCDRPDWVVLRR
ncbi:MAG: acetylxylan esterase [Myxococcales bacterium]|nr:acetylxylan esterase [Myxococcales bacterium]